MLKKKFIIIKFTNSFIIKSAGWNKKSKKQPVRNIELPAK